MKKFNFLTLGLVLVSPLAFADGDFFTQESKRDLERHVTSLIPMIESENHLELNEDSLECVGSSSMMGNPLPVGSCLVEGYDATIPNSDGIYQITLIDREGDAADIVVTLITSEL